MDTNIKIGNICRCQHGVIGIVMRIENPLFKQQRMYYGQTLDGREWQSKSPELIANNIQDYLELSKEDRKYLFGLLGHLEYLTSECVDDPEEIMNELGCELGYKEALEKLLQNIEL